MLSISVSSVLDRAAFFLNDVNRAYFTNAVLINPFKAAYDDLREELFDNNIEITNLTSAALVITTAMTDIGGETGPALPVDLISPIDLWERLSGANDRYNLMDKRQFLPMVVPVETNLGYWSWQNQIIKFIGATTARDVKMNYVGDVLIADEASSRINLYNAKSFLSYRTAALAAEFLGENTERADKLNSNARRSLDTLLNTDIKNQQSIVTRRRPFMAGYKSRGIY